MNTPDIREIYQNYPLSLLLEADPDIKKIEKYLNKGHCFAAFISDKIVGVYVLKDQKNKTTEIMNLAVDAKYRKQGIGRLLIQDAIQRAKTAEFDTLLIATGKDSFQQKFYESCGFSVYETEKEYFIHAYKDPVIDEGVLLTDLVRLSLNLKD